MQVTASGFFMPSRIDESEFVLRCVMGNTHAHAMIMAVFSISQTLDDLIDKDKELADDVIFNAFHACLVELPRNPFYLHYVEYLTPLFSQYLMDWYDATKIERMNTEHLKNVAFGLRSNVGSLITQCAYLVGGIEHQHAVSVSVKEHIWMETLEDYKREL